MNRRQFLISSSLAALSLNLQAAETPRVTDIEPGPDHPRNSEGSFVSLKSGRIVFFYTQFYGGAADNSAARIVRIHSDDDGVTWSNEPIIVVENTAGANVMSVSSLRLQNGAIALFYAVKNSNLDCRPVMRISTDEALTWSAPSHIQAAPGYFVLNNDRVIQLRNGKLIAPIAFHRARNEKGHDTHAITIWNLSDDNGSTWREAKTWWALPGETQTGLQEPGVVELADGRLFSWQRTDQGAQFGSYSQDGGETWSMPAPSALTSPVAPASIKRLPDSDKLLAVYDDIAGPVRTPLVTAISEDNGKTFSHRHVLEPNPKGWYCYTAIHFVKDAILLAYCAGDEKVGKLNRLRIRRLLLSELL